MKKLFLILISVFFICGMTNAADFSAIADLNFDSAINLKEPLPKSSAAKNNSSQITVDKLSYTPKNKRVNLSHLFSNDRQFEATAGSQSKGMMETGVEDLFIDNPRDQGILGSCHAFTSIAVLEIAYAKYYGKKIRLSEADLFLRRNVIRKNSSAFGYIMDGREIPALAEGGSARADTEFALENGVSRGERRDYIKAQMKYMQLRMGKANFLKPYGPPDATSIILNGEDDDFAIFEREDKVQEELIKYFELDKTKTVQSRKEIKKAFRGFKMKEEFYHWQTLTELISPTTSPEKCAKKAVGITSVITSELDKGRAVGVCMLWPPAAHCLTFIGYSNDNDGTLTFLARNSQGFDSSGFMGEETLCKVINVFSVINPSERN